MCRNPVCFSAHPLWSRQFLTQDTVLYSKMYFYFNSICWIHCVLFSIFSFDTSFAKDFMPSLLGWYHSARGRKTTVVRCMPKDERWNVHPRAACGGCFAWHLRPLPRLTAGFGKKPEAASWSRVLFYLSESASDLSGRTALKDPSLKACLLLLPFSFVTLVPAKDENESPGSPASRASTLALTCPSVFNSAAGNLCKLIFLSWICNQTTKYDSLLIYQASQSFFFFCLFFLENPCTVHLWNSHNLHSVL